MSSVRFIVRGKVQGVWFRAATQQQALALQVHGYARNLPDGGIEVLAQGGDQSLAALEAWLWQGPPLADVSDVRREDDANTPALSGFTAQ